MRIVGGLSIADIGTTIAIITQAVIFGLLHIYQGLAREGSKRRSIFVSSVVSARATLVGQG
jgi:hypothetical protein